MDIVAKSLYKSSPLNSVAYFTSQKVSKDLVSFYNSLSIHVKDWIKDTFTAHTLLLPFRASFMPRLAITGDIASQIYGLTPHSVSEW